VGGKGQGADQADVDQPITPRHIAMTWAQITVKPNCRSGHAHRPFRRG
jgi:hypothetical protein